jgi:hypothetical protein
LTSSPPTNPPAAAAVIGDVLELLNSHKRDDFVGLSAA